MRPTHERRASPPQIDVQTQSPLWKAQPLAEQTVSTVEFSIRLARNFSRVHPRASTPRSRMSIGGLGHHFRLRDLS